MYVCLPACLSVCLSVGKTQCFATFLPVRAPASSFLSLFLFSDLLSSSLLWLFPPLLFRLSILSEVWLLNFLWLVYIVHKNTLYTKIHHTHHTYHNPYIIYTIIPYIRHHIVCQPMPICGLSIHYIYIYMYIYIYVYIYMLYIIIYIYIIY